MASVNFQAEEVEREKKLILEGKIPVEEASKELMEHPEFKISQLTRKIIEEKRTKVSALKSEYPFPGDGEEALNRAACDVFVAGKSVVFPFSNVNTRSIPIPLSLELR
jgi:hypothetical protein